MPGRRQWQEHLLPDIASSVEARREWALLLDVDGTLLDIAARPDLVVVPPDLPNMLCRLHDAFCGALAIVTGRTVLAIDTFFDPLKLIIAGVHGTEWRTEYGGGVVTVLNRPAPLLLADIERLPLELSGVEVELKDAGVAVHYRGRPSVGPLLRQHLERSVARYDPTYTVEDGSMVIELLPVGHSKRRAVAQIMKLPAFVGRRPIAIGDDRSDDESFGAVVSLGGLALPVAGDYFKTGAATFSGPEAVRDWLTAVTRAGCG
jgi:trehalose 6-phosphate phosphatase